ncbi:MAG: ThiF family adenylyltransferase [Phycisphaerae bacterium]|nr:ThiF family adenylyltransferase [Phycisphaerae bacterium]
MIKFKIIEWLTTICSRLLKSQLVTACKNTVTTIINSVVSFCHHYWSCFNRIIDKLFQDYKSGELNLLPTVEYIIRFSQKDFNALKEHLLSAGNLESQAFALCSKAKGAAFEILICDKLILPDAIDLRNQSQASVEPSQEHQAIVYGLACELGLCVVDIHTHPFSRIARFSPIDNYHGEKNARYLANNFPENSMMGMIVFGGDLEHFDAQIWNSEEAIFEPVQRLEILGYPTTILDSSEIVKTPHDKFFARHQTIPGWKQGTLERLKVFVCGLGGNGSLVFESLVNLGVGKYGWIKACDPDVVEPSNLPRIPYAFPRDIGKPKAEISQVYADNKGQGLKVYCYHDSIESDWIKQQAKEANVIISAVDNDGARKIINSLAARYMIPCIDLGTEIILEESSYESIGQVQVFIPCKTGCFMCSGAIDPSQAALDLLTEQGQQEHADIGYIRGTNETPTPSVLHLNGVVSHLGISHFLRMVFGDSIDGKEYVHYDRQRSRLITAAIKPSLDCPICGRDGYLGAGDIKENEKLCLNDIKDSNITLINGDIKNDE